MTRPCQAIVVTIDDENDAATAGEAVPEETETDERMEETRRYGQGPGRPPSKKQRILAWLADRQWEQVSEERAAELAHTFPDCSDDTRRAALLEAGIPLAPVIEGVVQDTYWHMEASLAALLVEYLAAEEADNKPRIQLIRAGVIRAKEHAEFAANNPKVHDRKRKMKAEMALWLHTWLQNPPLFSTWVELRKRRIGGASAEPEA
jgi:hypothetical protein